MIDRIVAFLALASADRARLVRALWLLPRAHIALRLRGLGPTPYYCRQSVACGATGVPEAARRCRWAIDTASAHGLVRGTCLSRSLALLELIRREGIHGTLRLGTSLDGGRFDAHAWVEIDNVPLNEGTDVAQRYRPFVETDPAK